MAEVQRVAAGQRAVLNDPARLLNILLVGKARGIVLKGSNQRVADGVVNVRKRHAAIGRGPWDQEVVRELRGADLDKGGPVGAPRRRQDDKGHRARAQDVALLVVVARKVREQVRDAALQAGGKGAIGAARGKGGV